LVAWFDGQHLSRSPAQWDPAKLAWVNAQYLKQADDQRLLELARTQLQRRGLSPAAGQLDPAMCALFKDRCTTTAELADWLAMYCAPVQPAAEDLALHVTDAVRPALAGLAARLADVAWNKASISAAIKDTLAEFKLKMPQLALPLRVLVCGRAQTPSVDAVLALFPRATVLQSLAVLA